MNLRVDASYDNDEDLDFDKHVNFLSSIFNRLKIPLGNIFSELYYICIDAFTIENSSTYISINYDNNSILINPNYKRIGNTTFVKSKQREYSTKTKEKILSTFFFNSVQTGNLDERTFVKKYTLSDYDVNNMNHSIIYVLHEICMQYYASILLKDYEYPNNTFEIIIPHIRGIYLSCQNGIKYIEIHNEYIPNNPSENKLSILSLRKIISDISHSRSITMKRKSKTIKKKGLIKSNSLPQLITNRKSKVRNDNKSVRKISSAKSRKRERSVSQISLIQGGKREQKITNIIMLHNTIVQFFEYLKTNYLLHLDTANRNIYFYREKLVIIDFGESYIVNPSGTNSLDNIVYPKPEYQHDGYPVSSIISTLQEYNTKKEYIKKWLYGELQDNLQECYGGLGS